MVVATTIAVLSNIKIKKMIQTMNMMNLDDESVNVMRIIHPAANQVKKNEVNQRLSAMKAMTAKTMKKMKKAICPNMICGVRIRRSRSKIKMNLNNVTEAVRQGLSECKESTTVRISDISFYSWWKLKKKM